ncbi:Extensin-like, C-terminal [Rhabdaerophilaceae bacterium]
MLRSRHPVRVIGTPIRVCLALLASVAFLSGCGFVKLEQREAWRGQAEAACMKAGVVKPSDWVRITKPVEGPGVCGFDIPLKVAAFKNDQSLLQSFAASGTTGFAPSGADLRLTILKPEATLTCPMVAWLDDWLATAVQPAALAWFGQGVKEIRSGGSYACRRRNHQPGARLSEHAFGNAMDIMGFVLADGSVVTVKGGWRGTPAEQGFLRDTLHAACDRFRTVLGPGSDAFHYDHFHLDLARHDPKGQRRYCRPKLEAPQRPAIMPQGVPPMPPLTAFGGPAAAPPATTPPVALTQAPRSQQVVSPSAALGSDLRETEEEFNPADFDVTSSVLDLPRPRGTLVDRQPLPHASTGMFNSAPAPRSSTRAPANRDSSLRLPPQGH